MKGQDPDESQIEKIEASLNILDNILKSSKYVAGDDMTLADFALIATVSTLDVSKYDEL